VSVVKYLRATVNNGVSFNYLTATATNCVCC